MLLVLPPHLSLLLIVSGIVDPIFFSETPGYSICTLQFNRSCKSDGLLKSLNKMNPPQKFRLSMSPVPRNQQKKIEINQEISISL